MKVQPRARASRAPRAACVPPNAAPAAPPACAAHSPGAARETEPRPSRCTSRKGEHTWAAPQKRGNCQAAKWPFVEPLISIPSESLRWPYRHPTALGPARTTTPAVGRARRRFVAKRAIGATPPLAIRSHALNELRTPMSSATRPKRKALGKVQRQPRGNTLVRRVRLCFCPCSDGVATLPSRLAAALPASSVPQHVPSYVSACRL